jgi:adenylate kinase family enzyme
MVNHKIYLCGSAGVGKTTLAKEVAELTGLPFISGSAKELSLAYGFKSHKELLEAFEKDAEFAMQYQYGLLDYRKTQAEELDGFITDRSPIDNIAYFLLSLAHKISTERAREYIEYALESIKEGSKVVFLQRHPGIALENDNHRLHNEYYQALVEYTIAGVINSLEKGSPLYPSESKQIWSMFQIKSWDLEEKIEFILKISKYR